MDEMQDLKMRGAGDRDRRFAQLAYVLGAAVRAGDLQAPDALRVLRHELRRRNTRGAERAAVRSQAAQDVINKYGKDRPRNGSDEALHVDHVWRLTEVDLDQLRSVDAWLEAMPRLNEVVCVTARENYQLMAHEREHPGPNKYGLAGITWAAGYGLPQDS